MNQPPIALVKLNSEEKDQIAVLSHKNLVKGITMYLIPFVLFGFLVAYENLYYEKFGLQEHQSLREWLNVILVFLTILPARLFVNVLLNHKKCSNAWQKKVIRGKITQIDGKIITCVNQKIRLTAEQIVKVKVNDEVIVSAVPFGNIILSVEVVTNEQ
ncbi:MAG: hypothetical protein NT084_14155 [Bacteroidetes bacterium]|jgi:hypothetical protein|nr:hypothetical protein [Bacteroidota bacterium]